MTVYACTITNEHSIENDFGRVYIGKRMFLKTTSLARTRGLECAAKVCGEKQEKTN